MNTKLKKILTIILLFPCIQSGAQEINWDNLNLASTEAKILNRQGNRSMPNNQLIIQNFETKDGKIAVYLPPLSSSATISGTVYLTPTGKDSSRNLIALQTNQLRIAGQVVPLQRGSFQINLPTDPGTVPLQLKNSAGQIIKSEQLPVTQTTGNSTGFIIPPYIVSGDQSIITGNFDGNMSNTSIKINRESAQLLAESPSRLFFTSSAGNTGKTTVVCNENGNTQISTSNILKLNLSAEKTELRRGQQTQLHIKITGLEGLEEKVPVIITNTSPSVINLEGGETQQVNISPGTDAPSGVFELTRNIQSTRNGGFSVRVHIIPYSTKGPK